MYVSSTGVSPAVILHGVTPYVLRASEALHVTRAYGLRTRSKDELRTFFFYLSAQHYYQSMFMFTTAVVVFL